ncbi:hypothetical protein X766_34500 [Mesorhizobium sp. LSJC255A00]|uniref:hypothetical protein n=1 Tax=Mesorhizobium sp. LSJC255A00 TaxID=1287313 RepID=UPI0003CDE5AE|nr:hypothetical protein [Mesorhizobium sp. LSJC255A00]ESX07792.1 hypothetical protein X766_34500 [Mesorhizobium sp. LSJC255A00]
MLPDKAEETVHLEGATLIRMAHGPLARYYHESGNKDRAIELIVVALKSLGDQEPMPDRKTRLLKIKPQSPHSAEIANGITIGTLANSPIVCGEPAVSMSIAA